MPLRGANGQIGRWLGDSRPRDFITRGQVQSIELIHLLKIFMMLVPVVSIDDINESVGIADREPEPGDWRMFARGSKGLEIYQQSV